MDKVTLYDRIFTAKFIYRIIQKSKKTSSDVRLYFLFYNDE